mmetsp:Transcript_11711/g.19769  ORF Transcript_11711/g.19769 Transcript_11711/m.19769 type:complete len:248 (-) Transcript_11711:91-834(-)
MKKVRDLKVNGTIYTGAYFGLIKKYKNELKLTKNDEFDLFWKALFIFAIQAFFISCIVQYGAINFTLNNQTYLQLTMIFCTLLIHLNCLNGSRSGIYMMKYALCHPDEFVNSQAAFLLGLIQFSTMWVAELINIIKLTQKLKPQDMIAGLIAFKVIIDIPTIYFGSLESPIKAKVGKLMLKRARKASRSPSESMGCQGLFNLIYVLNKWFFNTIYFYFFAFITIILPFVQLLVIKQQEDDDSVLVTV